MKQKLNLATWNRKAHFEFFKTFDQPYYGVTVNLDCTRAYQTAKALGVSFYSYYLHKTLVAINALDNFKYRIEGGEVYVYDSVDASATILRDDKTFGFSYIKYLPDVHQFNQGVMLEIARVKNTSGLFTTGPMDCIVHFSALPWINFTSTTQAFNMRSGDSCPQISIGKLMEADGRKQMAYSIHVHHALVDGYHLGLFFEMLQGLLDE